MSLFFKSKKGNLVENGFAKNRTDYFQEVVEKKKVKLATWLSLKTGGYSPNQKKIALISFCILFGGLSLRILWSSVEVHHSNKPSLVVTHIRSGVRDPFKQHISDSLFQKAKKENKYLDSLRVNDTVKFKAILLAKPYLLQNLELIERIYQSQNK
jgi:hypothetical protein